MIKYIKPTIENPNYAVDDGNGIVFIKEFFVKSNDKADNNKEQKNRYFMSVSKSYDG
mgnify:CR=1 FL=1